MRVEWMDEAERTRRDEKKYERKEEKKLKEHCDRFFYLMKQSALPKGSSRHIHLHS